MTAPDDSARLLIKEPESDAGQGPFPPWRVLAPNEQTSPVVFASPHSGSDYPPEFLAASKLGALKLRGSEDAFMDEVFAAAPDLGTPLLCARFPRAYVDANREAFELDPKMFTDPLPDYVNTSSPRVSAGLGTIARIVTDGDDTFTLSNRDFNVRSFRSNVVLRWEWRPGSTLYIVWQQNRESRMSDGQHVGLGGLFDSLRATGDNIFAVKTTLWTSR